MHFICEKLKDEEGFRNIRQEVNNVYASANFNLKDEETKVKDLEAAYNKAKGNFEIVKKSLANPDADVYCQKIEVFLEEVNKQVIDFLKTTEQLNSTYTDCCTFFMFDKGDDKAKSTVEFFKFFTTFFDTIIKCMPKEEKKKKVETGGGARKYQVGQRVQGMGDVMSELKNKQMMMNTQ